MAKFDRFNGTVLPFASNATGLNRTIFGDTVQSDDINLNLNDKFKLGWEIVGPNEAPTKQDFNALSYTTTYLLSYLYQQGIPEWNENQKYYVNSYVVGSDGMIYRSLTGDETNPNIGNNPINDTVNWRPIIKYEDFANVDLSNVEDSVILNKLKLVDGSGSGLDADTVDGKHADDIFLKDADFDSGWFAIATDGTYTIEHGLGVAPRHVSVYVKSDGANNEDGLYDNEPKLAGILSLYNANDSYFYGTVIESININNITIKTGNISVWYGAVSYDRFATGYARIFAWK